jgi:hypothetical protein
VIGIEGKTSQFNFDGFNLRVEINRTGDDPRSTTVKIVSGVERSAIPDTIKMSEAAGRKLWGFN